MYRAFFSFLFSSLIAVLVVAQPGGGSNRTDPDGKKQGVWTKPWPNGHVRYVGQFKDDRPVGEFLHYDEDGILTTNQRYSVDGATSRAQHYYTEGSLMAAGKYVGQVKDSTWNYYSEDGVLRRVERFSQGKLTGEMVVYYANGQVAEKEHYVNGALHGDHRSWFEDGALKSEAHYVNGEPEGRMGFWYPNGKKEIEGKVVNGDRDGTWYYYNQDGSIQLQVLYRNGEMVKEKKENGTFVEYYDDGQIKAEITYKKGSREGRCTEYFNNGTWVIKPVPADPVLGVPEDVESVLEGQTLKMEGTFRNDQYDGEIKEYDERGRLLKVTRYSAGEVIGAK